MQQWHPQGRHLGTGGTVGMIHFILSFIITILVLYFIHAQDS